MNIYFNGVTLKVTKHELMAGEGLNNQNSLGKLIGNRFADAVRDAKNFTLITVTNLIAWMQSNHTSLIKGEINE
ncbi:hypothetical protein [Sideroxyarcus sp. TK5]